MSSKDNKAISTLRAGVGVMASIIPQTIDDAYRLSKMAFMAGMLKKQRVRQYDEETRQVTYVDEADEACLARGTMQILQGLDIGMPPMQALQLLALIGNRIVAHSEGIPALLWSKGFKLREWTEGEGDARISYCEVTRPDGTQIVRSFSVAQAKHAGLWSPSEKVKKTGKGGKEYETTNDSAWHRFDFRMLMHRARGYAVNDGASDATRGVGVREIVEDAYVIDATPATSTALAVPDDIADEPAAETVSEAEASQDALLANPRQYMERLSEQLQLAESEEVFRELCEAHGELVEAGRFEIGYQNEGEALMEKHGKRFKGRA